MPVYKNTVDLTNIKTTNGYNIDNKNKELAEMRTSVRSNTNDAKDEQRERIVIICAVDVEYKNAKEAFKVDGVSPLTDKEDDFGFRYLNFPYKQFEIILIKTPDKGMISAASVATASILAFHPKLVAMTGICAGRNKKTALGDIIIAKRTFDYEAGKIEKNLTRHRPDPIPIPKGIGTAIQYIEFLNSDFIDCVPHEKKKDAIELKINVHFKHIASGSSVLCNSEIFENITKEQDEVYGVDMEAYGIAYAANYLDTAWIVIKGIQDYADEQKSDIEDKYRECAAFSSVLVLQKLLNSDDFLNSI